MRKETTVWYWFTMVKGNITFIPRYQLGFNKIYEAIKNKDFKEAKREMKHFASYILESSSFKDTQTRLLPFLAEIPKIGIDEAAQLLLRAKAELEALET